MKNIIEAIIFGFSEILNYKVIKKALIIGASAVILWSIIGYFMWDTLLSFSNYFLDLIPFSMLRDDGVWMLSVFLWAFIVLVTFALILVFFGSIILEKVSKEKYEEVSIFIILISSIAWGIVWFVNSQYIQQQLSQLLTLLPFKTIEGGIGYLLAFYFIYTGIIITLLFVTSMFSASILEGIKNKEFRYDLLLDEDEVKTTQRRVKDIIMYVILSIIAFPLMFIPIVNIILQLALWVWLIKDTFVRDNAVLVIPLNERKQLFSEYKVGFLVLATVTAMFNFIPVFNILGPFFGELSMFYYLRQINR